MNQFQLFIAALYLSLATILNLNAQPVNEVQTEITSENEYELSIVRVYPDSFPEISVVYQAQNKLGMPIWEMTPDELSMYVFKPKWTGDIQS
jgi:hypothetical protein